jgi:hypothetical protein
MKPPRYLKRKQAASSYESHGSAVHAVASLGHIGAPDERSADQKEKEIGKPGSEKG